MTDLQKARTDLVYTVQYEAAWRGFREVGKAIQVMVDAITGWAIPVADTVARVFASIAEDWSQADLSVLQEDDEEQP